MHHATGYQHYTLPAHQFAYSFAFKRKKRNKLLQQEQRQDRNDAINERYARIGCGLRCKVCNQQRYHKVKRLQFADLPFPRKADHKKHEQIQHDDPNIVIEMGYAADLHREALIATGVVLFVFILLINLCFSLVKGGKDYA